jgi:hypothetical protein
MNFFGLTETVTGFVLDSDILLATAVVGIIFQILKDNSDFTVELKENEESKDQSKRRK